MQATRASTIRVLLFAGLITAACLDSTLVETPSRITVQSSADSLVANGLGSALLTAELPATLPQDAVVDFSTSLGRLINPAGVPERKVSIRAREGTAQVHLIPMGETGTAYVTATGAGSSVQTTVELTPSLPQIIDLFVDRTAAPADGATPVTGTAVLRRSSGAVSRGIPVRFEARDSATQAPIPGLAGIVAADSGGAARFRLTSAIPATVQVRAWVGTVESDTRTIRFTVPPAAATRVHRPGSGR